MMLDDPQNAGGPSGSSDTVNEGPQGFRVRRVLGAAVAVIAGSFLVLFVPVIVYA